VQRYLTRHFSCETGVVFSMKKGQSKSMVMTAAFSSL
jgi:hypothetical protein